VPVMVEQPTQVRPTTTFKKDSQGPTDSEKQEPEDATTTQGSYGYNIVATRETEPDPQDKRQQTSHEATEKKPELSRGKAISSSATSAESKSLDGRSKVERELVPVMVEKPSQVRPTVMFKKDSQGPPDSEKQDEPEEATTERRSYGHNIVATRKIEPDPQDKKRQAPLNATEKKAEPPREKATSTSATSAESKSLDGKSKAGREPVLVMVEQPTQVKKDFKDLPNSEKQEPEDATTEKQSYGHCI
jgi:hypothetical protein